MRIRRLIIIITSVLLLYGCTPVSTTIGIGFTNNSSYDIALTNRYGYYYKDNLLHPGETKWFWVSNEDSKKYSTGIADFWLMADIVFVQFDEELKVRTTTERYTTESNFEVVYQEEKSARYTYTFTDADYQYALENGTPLEWPTVND